MRRILTAGITVLTVAMTVVAAPALAEELAGTSSSPGRVTFDLPATDHPVLLQCQGRVVDRGPVVVCHWRADGSVEISGWQLWRLRVRPARDGRELVAELGADVTGYQDTTVTAPAAYLYVVVGVDRSGEIVARSRPSLARVVEHSRAGIHLGCHLGWDPSVTDAETSPGHIADPVRHPAIGCRWAPSDRAVVRGYVVLRSVDGGTRTVIAEVGADVMSIVDPEVAFGHSYTYLVQGLDHEGEVVAHSRPVKVGVPRWHRDWPTDRVHDRIGDRIGDDQTDWTPDRELHEETEHETDRLTDGLHDGVVDRVGDHHTDRPSDGEPDRTTDRERDGHPDATLDTVIDAERWSTGTHDDDPSEPVVEESNDPEPSTDRPATDH